MGPRYPVIWASLVAQTVKKKKKSVCNAGDQNSIPESGRFPGEGNGYPLVFLPGEFYGQRSLVGYSPRGCKESDPTERLTHYPVATVLWYTTSEFKRTAGQEFGYGQGLGSLFTSQIHQSLALGLWATYLDIWSLFLH